MNPSDAARALRGARGLAEVECAVCGRRVRGYPGRMYCSSACNSRAWRERHPEEAREKSRRNWKRRKVAQQAK